MDKPESEETLLESFEFLEYDDRWRGAVEIVRKDVSFRDGNQRTYTDVRVRVGQRWLVLPRRGLTEIIRALGEAQGAIDNYTQPAVYARPPRLEPLPEEEPRRKRPFNPERRASGRKNRGYEEYDE